MKKKFRKKIYELVRHLSSMKMDMGELLKNQVIPKCPYERAGSEKFFSHVKMGDIDKVSKMLKKNKYYVYDFDNIKQTATHWAAKRNYYKIIDLLVEYGANANALDIGGRTPLYLATKENNPEAVKSLLMAGAVPMYKTHSHKTSFDVASSDLIERLLVKA